MSKTGDPDIRVLSVRYPRGMLRRPSQLVIPADVARLSQNMEHKDGLARRRKGAIVLGRYAGVSTGGFVFDGTNNKYVKFPDHSAYDLKTKWWIALQFQLGSGFTNLGCLAARDVHPTSAGKRTFAVFVDANRMLYVWVNDSDGTLFTLQGTNAISKSTDHSVVVYRNGATLAAHIDGNPTAEDSRTDLSATKNNIAGAQAIGVGCISDDDYTSNFSNKLDGQVNSIVVGQDFASVEKLLKWTTVEKYPNPRDPRIILAAYFTYSKETGAVAKDWSRLANHGTVGGSPSRAASGHVAPQVVQHLSLFYKRSTDELQNIAFIGGDFFKGIVRAGTS